MEEGGGDTGINKGTFLNYLFEARRRAYTKKNILAAWDKAGIEPFNLRRVLDYIAAPPPSVSFPISGPTTPRTTRMARSTAKEALGLIYGTSDSAVKLRNLIKQMDKGLQISITEREICEYISAQFRKSVAKKSARASTNDRKILSKARVITSEDVEKLREARNAADAEKAAKAVARDIKKNLKEEKGTPIPKIKRQKGRKKITILDETIIHLEGVGGVVEGGGGVVEEELEWANIEDFSEIQTPPLPPKPRTCGRKKACRK